MQTLSLGKHLCAEWSSVVKNHQESKELTLPGQGCRLGFGRFPDEFQKTQEVE